ncbi:hypothetical protein DMN91_006649 [Ooceraea biroi]|uniref:Uncharacterized protein n=1 Tax=Ooceraea biroi TaxID=2015173 RepID=A0A3L8DIS6_OOCBI|nr:hypothetical protein DMN91_006649 [Ooceraea biroi]
MYNEVCLEICSSVQGLRVKCYDNSRIIAYWIYLIARSRKSRFAEREIKLWIYATCVLRDSPLRFAMRIGLINTRIETVALMPGHIRKLLRNQMISGKFEQVFLSL